MTDYMKKNNRWKTISKLIIEIQVAPTAKCWRIKTNAETTEPIPQEDLSVKQCKIGKGKTYLGIVNLKRIPQPRITAEEFYEEL